MFASVNRMSPYGDNGSMSPRDVTGIEGSVVNGAANGVTTPNALVESEDLVASDNSVENGV